MNSGKNKLFMLYRKLTFLTNDNSLRGDYEFELLKECVDVHVVFVDVLAYSGVCLAILYIRFKLRI